jgi:outer membrane PBP1 activator LpoA protein
MVSMKRSLLFMVLLITACQPIKQGPVVPAAPVNISIVAAEQQGNFAAAAQQYQQLAEQSQGRLQALYWLQAAKMWWQAQQDLAAQAALDNIATDLLKADEQTSVAMLTAQLALFDQQANRVLKALASVDITTLPSELKVTLLRLKISAYELKQDWLNKAKAHIALATLLSADNDKLLNQKALWHSLMQLTPQTLEQQNPGIAPAVDSGWFALALLIKNYQDRPAALDVALEDWKRLYPNHPANPVIYSKSISAGTRLPANIKHIAVLLHDAGPYVTAANAIRQGIIAALYADNNSEAQLRFYTISDSGSGHSNVVQQYQRAVTNGAEVVIGPLDKRSVDALSQAEKLPIPVLALNRTSAGISRANLYQFGLAPEDDAKSVAHYAQLKGYQRVVILAPDADWGSRVSAAFSQAWSADENAVILNQASYPETSSDFSAQIPPLFDIDDSEQRYSELRRLIGTMDFEPRRRQDIDFIFLVANPLKARQLVTQLRFHRSGQLPILATSHAYAGQANAQQDIDLNGLEITDVPWVFAANADKDPAYQALLSQSQQGLGSLIRLYAMGADAYRLLDQLNTMSRSASTPFNGATGTLTIDDEGVIKRDMFWGKVLAGLLKPIEVPQGRVQ